MKYIPGVIHQKYQRVQAIQLNNGFNFLCLKEGIRNEDHNFNDESQYEIIELQKNDIFLVQYFKKNLLSTAYTFFIKHNDKEINLESIVSREFIEVNLTERKENGIFTDITRQFVRDQRLNQILN